jgi:distribution and morphology protein 34
MPPTPAKPAAAESSAPSPSPEAPPPAYTPALDPLLRKRAALAAEKAAAVETLLRPSFSAERLVALRGGKPRGASSKSAGAAPSAPSSSSTSTGGILERAWMMKVAREVRRRVEEERGGGAGAKGFEAGTRASSVGSEALEGPPPAYVS